MKRVLLTSFAVLLLLVTFVNAYSDPATPEEVVAGWTGDYTVRIEDYGGVVYSDTTPIYVPSGVTAQTEYATAYCKGVYGSYATSGYMFNYPTPAAFMRSQLDGSAAILYQNYIPSTSYENNKVYGLYVYCKHDAINFASANSKWYVSNTSNSPSSLVTFRVVDAQTFSMISGALVNIGDGNTITTGTDGTAIATVINGVYSASASKSGYTLTNGNTSYIVNASTSITVPIFLTYIGTPTPTPTTTPSTGIPVASYSYSSLTGSLPLTITLTDTSTPSSNITSRLWAYYDPTGNFYSGGSGTTSTITATSYGLWSVTLRVDNVYGYDVSTQYLSVSSGNTPTPTPTATPVTTATTAIPEGGGTVAWDKSTYNQDDPATITYSIYSGYWDTSTYTYAILVKDNYGVTKNTLSLDVKDGTQTIADLDATNYPPGIYYANLHMNGKSTSADYTMNTSKMTVTGSVIPTGYVMDAQTGSVLSGANVYVIQGSSATSMNTSSDGVWSSENSWVVNSNMSITTSKSGYTTDVRSISPLKTGYLNLNISLLSTSPTCVGVCLGGIVRDTGYGNLINGATVIIDNTTYSDYHSTTTNIAGYYRVDNLVNNRLYDSIIGSKSGYSNSTTYQKAVVGS